MFECCVDLVCMVLFSCGISLECVVICGYGKEYLVVSNGISFGCVMNCWVEVIIFNDVKLVVLCFFVSGW